MRKIQPLLASLVLSSLFVSASSLAAETTGNFKQPLGIQVDTSLTYNDNVTRGYDSTLSDSSIDVSLRKGVILPVSGHARALLTGLLDGEIFQHYRGLSRISGGVKGAIEYRSSAEFIASTYSVFANAFLDQYNSDLRDGQRYSAGISFRRPLTDRIRLYAALASNKRKGSHSVFETSDNSFGLNLDYDLNRTGTLYVGGERRNGDIVTTGYGNSVLNTSAWDDAFPGSMYCSRLKGTTTITTLGYNLGMGTNDSIDLSWRKIKSTLDSASIAELNNVGIWSYGYTTNLYSIAYLKRF